MWRDTNFLYLDHTQVETYMPSYGRIVELLEITLRDKFEGKADCPVKIAVSPKPEMYIHALPGFLPSFNVAGLKWQSNVVDNPSRGLPFNMGFVVLNEPDIGAPRALMDCMWITACRTAGISMVAVKHLARSGANTVGLIGLGMQGRMHLRALRETAPHLWRVKCYDRDPAALSRFIQEAAGHGPPDAIPCKTPEEAVRGFRHHHYLHDLSPAIRSGRRAGVDKRRRSSFAGGYRLVLDTRGAGRNDTDPDR